MKLCHHLDGKAGVSRSIVRQLLRSATSIGANVEEAQAGQTKADFIFKITIALKEARETDYWLRMLVAADLVSRPQVTDLQREAGELKKILAAIMVSAKKPKSAT